MKKLVVRGRHTDYFHQLSIWVFKAPVFQNQYRWDLYTFWDVQNVPQKVPFFNFNLIWETSVNFFNVFCQAFDCPLVLHVNIVARMHINCYVSFVDGNVIDDYRELEKNHCWRDQQTRDAYVSIYVSQGLPNVIKKNIDQFCLKHSWQITQLYVSFNVLYRMIR